MIDRSQFNAEDFLVDNTFQLYCSGTDQLCVDYWEKYLKTHPEQESVIMEAKRLFIILSGNKRALNNQLDTFKKEFNADKPLKVYKNYLWLKVAAAIVLIAGAVFLYRNYGFEKVNPTELKAQVFCTKSGERKKVSLPDGSIVLLNAKSSLSIDADFNDKVREVKLTGEAFFDVVHNKDKPFKVHTDDFNINVLGTSFNVKAYPDENTSEATLIRGLITMEAVNGNGGMITLKPSQKVTFYKIAPLKENHKLLKPTASRPEITINHYTLIKDSSIVETAWTKGKIEIYDQNFAEIKGALEKWFGVNIQFKDKQIEKYRFTATFSHETLEDALKALQNVEYFKYEIKGNEVTISK
ncbi:FecR family protein [Pedobacter nototheniae]|uniref:FecR family protein n=1 Tax=Pedobacter nototheniae TaxID=2488994 RepID=UPI00103A022C|nr:FecR domain-containing protein [Pedobacter nototheniae]